MGRKFKEKDAKVVQSGGENLVFFFAFGSVFLRKITIVLFVGIHLKKKNVFF